MNRIQLATDGNKVYRKAVERAFGSAIDFRLMVKLYEFKFDDRDSPERLF